MSLKFPKSEKYNFTKNLVKHHKLATHLDRYLANEVEELNFAYTPKEKDDGWHPSGHCTPPPTELYAIATGATEARDWGVSMLKTFMVGHFWHQLLQKAVLDLGFAEPSAIERRGIRGWGEAVHLGSDVTEHNLLDHYRYPAYHYVTGSGDVAPIYIPGCDPMVVDFKTMGAHDFKNNGMPAWAADKYEAQINIYMELFNRERGLILCIQKDSPHEFKEFEFVRNQPLIDTIYDKWEFVSECLDEGTPPSKLDDELFSLPTTGPVAQ